MVQQQKVVAGRIHLAFCAELHQMQLSAGRYYLHEHPLTASSWKEKCITRIASKPENFTTRVHMCAYGMQIPDKNGNSFVYKPTQFMTNSPLIAAQLERKCDKTHTHARLASNAHTSRIPIPHCASHRALCRISRPSFGSTQPVAAYFRAIQPFHHHHLCARRRRWRAAGAKRKKRRKRSRRSRRSPAPKKRASPDGF